MLWFGMGAWDREANDSAPTVVQNHEDVQPGEPDRLDGEEVDGSLFFLLREASFHCPLGVSWLRVSLSSWMISPSSPTSRNVTVGSARAASIVNSPNA